MSDENTRTQPPDNGGTGTFSAPEGTGTFSGRAEEPTPNSRPTVPGYEILEPVGSGGMGCVFRARQLTTNRIVAVKLILAGEFAGAAARDRFRSEIETTAKLSHPHIVALYEAGAADGRAFLSCEFVPGGSLAARLDGTPWEAKRAARLLVPLAQAVAHAHAAKIVHRDLKPANILLAADGTPKVADFGIAKQLGSESHTYTGAILGTPSYMPPEQAGGAKAVGAPADVYALGAILYELLTGRPPFKGADFLATIDLVRTQDPVAPHVLQPKLPRDIETICLKCLQKDPAKRYPTADALAADLGRFLEGRPIVARPVGSVERGWRWTKRNPAVASLTGAVLLVLAIGTGVASFFAVRAEDRARDATDSAKTAAAREADANRERQRADDERDNLRAQREKTDALLYAAQIYQAHAAALEDRTTRLNQLLDDTRPQPGRPDRRGWEWHYLRRLTHSWDSEGKLDLTAPGFATFDPKRESLEWMFSADGTRALVLSYGGVPGRLGRPITRAGLFDTATGRRIREVPELKTSSDAFQYTNFGTDLRYVARAEAHQQEPGVPPGGAGKARYRVRMVNLDTGAVETPFPDLDVQPQVWVAPGGNRVVISPAGPAKGPRIEVWERGRSEPARAILGPSPGDTTAIVGWISPDTTIAVVVYTETLAKGKSDGPAGNRLELWDIAGKPVRRGPSHAWTSDQFPACCFSPGGQMVVMRDGPRTHGIYDTRTGLRVGRWEPRNPTSLGWWGHRVSDDGRRIATADPNGLVVADRIGDVLPGGFPPARMSTHPDDVGVWRSAVLRKPSDSNSYQLFPAFVLTPDGRRLTAGAGDGTYRTWDLGQSTDWATSWPERLRLRDEIGAAYPTARGRWVLYFSPFGRNDPLARSAPFGVYDALRRETVRTFEVAATEHASGTISPDGKRVLLWLRDRLPPAPAPPHEGSSVRWSVRAVDEPLRELVGGSESSAAFSDDGRWVIESRLRGPDSVRDPPSQTVRVYRAADGHLAREVRLDAHDAALARTWVTPAGALVISTHPEIHPPPDKKPEPVPLTLRFHDIETGAVRGAWSPPAPYPVRDRNTDAAPSPNYAADLPLPFFSADGRKMGLSLVAEDGSVRAWVLDAATGMPEAEFSAPPSARDRPVGAPPRPIWGVSRGAFGPGGRLAVWAGGDLVTWTGPGAAPVRLTGHDLGTSVAFSADGRRAFTLDTTDPGSGGGQQTLRVWELPGGRELITLRIPDERTGASAGGSVSRDVWLEGERLHVMTPTGVRVFDGTPLRK
ncbi:WD40 repeat domain-containing serine/threonine protein kinase [Frigoriglobus tundricola]|uniref:non-specific serine/threonine protein kinase n=1 Tax=Frigoriglobus tundricola TaxID=2774151 RepID=A0A6M5YZW8_9BACT|nr:serine/threonine-protein kinase [Frigoriglobus tundricola]QJW99495.1 hypothetical protein FTUN_7107 [Frigoriglobus tundricola]